MTRLLVACIAVGVSSSSLAAAEPIDGTVWSAPDKPKSKPQRPGPAFAMGIGYQTAGVGVQASFDGSLSPRFAVAPWVSVGVVPNPLGRGATAWASGVMVKFGDRSRAVLDLGVTPISLQESFSSWGVGRAETVVHSTTVYYGVVGAAGFEQMGRSGWFVRTMVGVAAGPTTEGPRAGPTLSVNTGFKAF